MGVNRVKKKFSVIASVLLGTAILFGCSDSAGKQEGKAEKAATEKKASDVKLGDYHVHLEGEVTEKDDLFVIEGKSNLLPGSRLIAEVWVDEDEDKPLADTTDLVDEDGNFYLEVDHHQYGEADIVVKFDLDGVQDDEIKRHYGEKGQKLEGPFIYKHKAWDGIFKKAEAKIAYDPNGDNDLTIEEPDLYDLPEDYGDPRVWIEADDIEADGEYFYIHGKSNILEGSKMKASYGGNRDRTSVKPDGSFDFKIDYEYLEDESFVIEFLPYDFQWNEIEEAYGKSGQKLVGDLVETNKYNNNQFVKKVIPWEETKE